jgi:hypothetical protein
MTQQYLAGELSVLLARLAAVATDPGTQGAARRLRREAETVPLWRLAPVEERALEFADDMCWAFLTREDTAGFDRAAAIGADLREFGVCSGLLPDQCMNGRLPDDSGTDATDQ